MERWGRCSGGDGAVEGSWFRGTECCARAGELNVYVGSWPHGESS